MKIRSLVSGSKGNASYIKVGHYHFLIDAGITYHRLIRCLETFQVELDDISALFITHTHKDHILGLAVLVKHSFFPIYIKEEMFPEIKDIIPRERIIFYQEEMSVKDLMISLVHTSHDAPGSVGFLFTYQNHSLVYITDTGYINRKYFSKLKNKEIYYIESNHDEKMLMNGPYPYVLKQRILSDKGHLSNITTGKYLSNLIGENTKYIILAHISETNNTKDLAYNTILQEINKTNFHPQILVASQDELGEEIEV